MFRIGINDSKSMNFDSLKEEVFEKKDTYITLDGDIPNFSVKHLEK